MSKANDVRGHGLRFGLAIGLTSLALTASAQAAIVVNDSWVDAGRNNGTDPLDSNWWTSSSSAGIEVSAGSLGLVTGTSGRGIHTVFPTQTLANVGDKLVVTYTFTTPTTLTTASGAFKVGIFDTLARAGLDADITSSSSSPSPLYGYFATPTAALPGYMMDMDVATGAEDLVFRQHDTAQTATTPTGRLLGTTTGFSAVGATGPDGAYTFAANTTYTGSITIERLNATEMGLTGTLGAASHSVTDTFDSADFGMLAFWANSNTFGSSATANTADNGIDFSNVTIEFVPVPEPTGAMLALVLAGFALRRGRRT